MTGWLIAAGLGLVVMAGLVLARLPRAAWEISGAALLLGLAGYAWQGHSGLAGSPRDAVARSGSGFDEEEAKKRRSLADRFGTASQWLLLSDGLARQGNTQDAANVLLSGLRATPNDANLWLGLGNALVNHADGALPPAADYAYRRALAIDPQGIAPRYFYGLALARNGQFREARPLWASLAAQAPAGSAIRTELQRSIARIDAMLSGKSSVAP